MSGESVSGTRRRALDADRRRGLAFVGVLALTMWIAEIADLVLRADLDAFGIRPRDVDGIDGIAFAPFLHGGVDHLLANTIPLLVLGATIALSGLVGVVAVTVIVAVGGVLAAWLLDARPARARSSAGRGA